MTINLVKSSKPILCFHLYIVCLFIIYFLCWLPEMANEAEYINNTKFIVRVFGGQLHNVCNLSVFVLYVCLCSSVYLHFYISA